MDAGVATAENLQLLRENRFGYLVNDSRRQRGRYAEQFGQLKGFSKVATARAQEPVWVRVMDDPYSEAEGQQVERVVLCKSQSRANKEQAMLSAAEQRLLQDLDKLAQRIEKNQLLDPSKIERAIGRMQARHSWVNRYYKIELKEQSGRAKLTYKCDHDRFEQAADLHGCYVLRTDERTLNENELWRLYISLTRAEAGFKVLKSNLGLRPNRHQIEPRVEGHVFICILAYHLLRNIGYSLEQRGDRRNWDTLKRILQTHCYTTILVPIKEGTLHRIRKAGQPEQCQKAIYEALCISWRGLPTHRSVLKLKSVHRNTPQSPPTL